MKIGEIAKMFGLSSEMLRYLEKQGLISPPRDKNGIYRDYDMIAVLKIFEYVKYRAIGLSVKSISELTGMNEPDPLVRQLKQIYAKTKRQIELTAFLNEYIEQYIDSLETLPHNLNRTWFSYMRPIRYIRTGSGKLTDESENENAEITTRWRKFVPYVSVGMLYEFDDARKQTRKEAIFLVERQTAERLQIPASVFDREIPRSLCLSTFVQTVDISNLDRVAENISREIKEKDNMHCTHVIARLLTCLGDAQNMKHYYHIQAVTRPE